MGRAGPVRGYCLMKEDGAVMRRINWTSLLLTLLALAVVYGVGTAFVNVEVERLVERTITPQIMASAEVEALSREIYGGIDAFMAARSVRAIGYTCAALMIVLATAGLLTERRGVASLGSIGFILPIYGYFLLHMSFLAGLGVLTALWTPLWGDLVRLGDVAYLPYVMVVYPFSLAGMDVRQPVAGLYAGAGLFLFILGVLTWFYARWQQKGTADFWIYRFTRHPQYLGWILWSYGLMLRVAQRHDTPLQQGNPGASLPWAISTLIIVCVALSEEISMRRRYGRGYEAYSSRAPFMLPLSGLLVRVISAPFRAITGRGEVAGRRDLLLVFVIYLAVVMFLSLPLVLVGWPGGGWMNWPLF